MTENHGYTNGPKNRIVKDLSFLLELPEIIISETTAKYIMEHGEGQVIKNIKFPIDIFYSYKQYDYTGNFISKNSQPMKLIPQNKLKDAIMSMKIKQKSWFNICNQPIHPFKPQNSTEDASQVLVPIQFKHRTGSHYQITLVKIEYKNYQAIEVKRNLNEQERIKGIQFFRKQQYISAAKIFKYLTCILDCSTLPKGTFNKEQVIELNQIHFKARINYFKCYFKIPEQQQAELHNFTQILVERYLKEKPKDNLSHYFHAKWLLKQHLYCDALDAAAKSNELCHQSGTDQLIRTIKIQKANRGKIRVEVPEIDATSQ